MVCARDEGLVRNIAHAIVSTEFSHISKTAYNNYLHERFSDREKNRTIATLRTKIGYTKEADGRIAFTDQQLSRKGLFFKLWRGIKSLT